jgi:hypothetical protein
VGWHIGSGILKAEEIMCDVLLETISSGLIPLIEECVYGTRSGNVIESLKKEMVERGVCL